MNFVDIFHDAVEKMRADAIENGISMNEVCKKTGAGRMTPNVWRIKTPKTVQLLADMQEVVRLAGEK